MSRLLSIRIVNEIISLFHRFFKNELLCYYIRGSKYDYDEIFPIRKASRINHLIGVVCDDAFRNIAQKRFDIGHSLFYCCDDNVLIAYGWKTGITMSYYSWEIANSINFQQSVIVLYDSFVSPNYRRRGIQKSLIHARINDCEDGTIVAVYAEPLNIASNKAISHCGFSLVAKLTHFSHKIGKEVIY
jgi:GNAT superfamily N-acetyltransferase